VAWQTPEVVQEGDVALQMVHQQLHEHLDFVLLLTTARANGPDCRMDQTVDHRFYFPRSSLPSSHPVVFLSDVPPRLIDLGVLNAGLAGLWTEIFCEHHVPL